MIENLGTNLLAVCIYSIFIWISLYIIQLTGRLMNRISDEHKDKEWVNTILAIVDIILITFILIVLGKMILIMIPYIMIFLVVMLIISLLALLYIFISEKIKEQRKNK